MDNKRLEFYLLLVVLLAFCIGTLGLIAALFFKLPIDSAVPLIDGTLGTLAMAMWKDFSHSNQDRPGDGIVQSKAIITQTEAKS